jgi:hypothetical protein
MVNDPTTQITTSSSGMLGTLSSNLNFLSPLGFKFTLKRSPNLNFFATEINVPSFEIGIAQLPTPFKILEIPGDKPRFGDLFITFKVDENLNNYLEIFNWLAKIGYPESFDQYASIKNSSKASGQGIVSDATLTILNSSFDPTTEVRFENLFPYSLSELNFSTANLNVDYITARVAFKFNMMKIITL